MANPFGGSGEALSKNTGHTNQANLVAAVVPRSTTVIKEVLGNTTATLENASFGTYDADGYLSGSTSSYSRAVVSFSASFNLNSSFTMIVLMKKIGGSNFNVHSDVRAFNGGYGPTAGYIRVRGSTFESSIYGTILDTGAVEFGSSNATSITYCGYAVASSAGSQKAGHVKASSTPPTGTYTASGTDTDTYGSHTINTLDFYISNEWGVQCAFLYADNGQSAGSGKLSDADIEAIIENPGAVLSQGGGSNIIRGVKGMTGGMQNLSGGTQ